MEITVLQVARFRNTDVVGICRVHLAEETVHDRCHIRRRHAVGEGDIGVARRTGDGRIGPAIGFGVTGIGAVAVEAQNIGANLGLDKDALHLADGRHIQPSDRRGGDRPGIPVGVAAVVDGQRIAGIAAGIDGQ